MSNATIEKFGQSSIRNVDMEWVVHMEFGAGEMGLFHFHLCMAPAPTDQAIAGSASSWTTSPPTAANAPDMARPPW